MKLLMSIFDYFLSFKITLTSEDNEIKMSLPIEGTRVDHPSNGVLKQSDDFKLHFLVENAQKDA